MAENLPKNLEIVATVTHSRHCANFISENETFVFDVNGCLPEKKSEQAVQKILILDKAEKILSRDIAVLDFRLPYRITLRFPENKDGQINSKVIGVSN